MFRLYKIAHNFNFLIKKMFQTLKKFLTLAFIPLITWPIADSFIALFVVIIFLLCFLQTEVI